MATPWQGATIKQLTNIGYLAQPLPAGRSAPGFSAPTHQKDIQFDAAQLKGSMAVAMVLASASAARSSAGATLSASVAANIASFLADFVDDSRPPDNLEIVRDVEILSDVGRTFLSSLFGAAVADQYMLALGYRFRCNSREIIGAGVAGDYLYDGISSNSSEVSMAEAKGSVVSFGKKLFIAGTARRGYRRQVEHHVGNSYPTGGGGVVHVVHGYCIGAGAIAGGGAAIGHVVETGASSAAAVPGNVGGGAPSGSSRATAAIVLRNYAAAFSLLNSPGTAELLTRFAATGKQARIQASEFGEIAYRDQPFMTAAQDRANLGYALWKPVFDQLRHLVRGEFSLEKDIELKLPEQDLLRRSNDGGAVLPDGLAVLPPDFQSGKAMSYPLEVAEAFDYANRMPMYR